MNAFARFCRCVLVAIASLAATPVDAAEDKKPLEINFVYFGEQNDSALMGVTQGVSEGNQQGQFLGQRYLLKVVPSKHIINIKDPVPTAIFAAVDAESLRLLSELNPGVPVFNLIEHMEDLRALCVPNLLHVIPDEQMLADAVGQWQKKNPGDTVEARAWHPAFEKYAGRQLNNRFTKAFRQGMDDYAWAGWAATKMVTDSIARLQSGETSALLAHLKTDLEFDGQKGVTMNFRPNGQLRQVILLVKDDKIVGEAPVRGVTSTDNLDSLGHAHCPTPQAAQR